MNGLGTRLGKGEGGGGALLIPVGSDLTFS